MSESESESPLPYERTETQKQPPFPQSVGDLPTQVPIEQSVGDLPTQMPGADSPIRVGLASTHAIPGYEIAKKLGGGGMGVVYLARQINLNRQVALKVIRAEQASNLDLARFAIEAEASARVKHPNIAQVFDSNAGTNGGRPYIAMEYCSGGNLAEFLDRQPQPPARAAAIAETLARAVQAAHEAEIIHRDLKPMNVLLELPAVPEGESKKGISSGSDRAAEVTKRLFSANLLKITDFGLAKKLDSLDGMTQTQSVMGTPSYMAPEQASGNTKQAGPGTDIWALGVILYEMLTGSLPFVGANGFEVISQVMKTDPVPPSSRVKVPQDLETICLKCLRKEPKDRYASAKDLADDLSAFREGRSISARPMSAVEKSVRWVKKNPSWAGMIAAVAASMMLGTGVSLWQANEARKESKRAEENAKQAEANATEAKSNAKKETDAKEELKTQVFSLSIATQFAADAAFANNSPDRAMKLLEQVPSAYRGFEWYHRQRQFSGGYMDLKAHQQAVLCVASSRDGMRVATADQDGTINIADSRTGALLYTTQDKDGITNLAFSPDGSRFATGSYNCTVKIRNASTGSLLAELTGHRTIQNVGQIVCLAFSPDGSQIVSGCSQSGSVVIWNSFSGKMQLSFATPKGVNSVAFSPDGTRIAVGVTAHAPANNDGAFSPAR